MDFPEHLVAAVIFKCADIKTKYYSKQVSKCLKQEFKALTTHNIECLRFILAIIMTLIYTNTISIKHVDIDHKGKNNMEKSRITYNEESNTLTMIHFGVNNSDVPTPILKFTPTHTYEEFTTSYALNIFYKCRKYKKIKEIMCNFKKVSFAFDGNQQYCIEPYFGDDK